MKAICLPRGGRRGAMRTLLSGAGLAGLAVCALLVTGRDNQSAGSQPVRVEADGAVLVCDEPIHDFGAVWSGDVVEHEFEIRNTGTERAWIKPLYCCATTRSVYYAIDPGERFGLPIRLNTKRMRTGIARWIYAKRVGPPEQGPPASALKCDAPDHDFGTVDKGEVIDHEFEVKNTSNQTVWVQPRLHRAGTAPWGAYKIHPNRTATIPVRIDTKRLSGDFELKISFRFVPPPGEERG